MNRIILLFKKIKKHRKEVSIANMMKCCFMRVFLHISLDDCFAQKLYSSMGYTEYVLKKANAPGASAKYKRSWRVTRRVVKPDETNVWYFLHHIDFLFSRFLNPGLDAMDYFRYEFYNIKQCKRKTFITEGGLAKLNNIFNGCGDESVVTDKIKFNSQFSKYVFRKWIATSDAALDEFQSFCTGLNSVIVKPFNGAQGKGVYIADVSNDDKIYELYKEIHNKKNIVEEIIVQNKSLSELNPVSVNTIRIYSVFKDNNVVITSAVLRIGNGFQPTDNYSSGGMAAAIDLETGIVISGAINKDSKRYFIHPYTGKTIIGFMIPCWNTVLETVKDAHLMIPDLRYMAWDVAVTEDNKITFIEANTWGGVELQQHPLLDGKKYLYQELL